MAGVPKLITLFTTPKESVGRVFTIWPASKTSGGDWEPGGNWRQTGPFFVFDVTNPDAWQRVGFGRTRSAAIHIERKFVRQAHARRKESRK